MTNKTVNVKIFIFLAITILVFISIYFVFGNLDGISVGDELLVKCSYISLFVWLFCVITCLINKTAFNNLYFLYLIMYGIFIFGYIICKYVIGYVDNSAFDLNEYVTIDYLAKGSVLSIYCLLGMHIGYLLKIIRSKNNIEDKILDNTDNRIRYDIMKKLAIIFLIFSVPFVLTSTIDDFRLASIYGYQGVYSNQKVGLASISSKIEPFFYIGLLMLIGSYKNEEKKAKKVLIFIILYNFILMFLGSRGLNILRILVALVFYHYKIKKFKLKNFIVIGAVCMIILLFIPIIKSFRKYGLKEWLPNINEIIEETMEDNILLNSISEMGGAIFPTASSIEYVDINGEYKYGTTYLYGFATLIPNFGTTEHSALSKSDTQAMVSKYFGLSFGGSVVQEAYINFGWFSWIFMIILGYIITGISDRFINSKDPIVYPLFCVFMVNFLWTIRNNIMPGLCRDILWYLIPIYILYRLILSKKEKEIFKVGQSKHINSSI